MSDPTLNYTDAPLHPSDDSVTVKATHRKIVFRLMSFLLLYQVLNYLDRASISFAQLQLKQDLGLSDTAYGLDVSLFFTGYILLGVPGTSLLGCIGVCKTATQIMLLWGIISTIIAFMNIPRQSYPVQVLFSATEADLRSRIVFYPSFWYPVQRRVRITS